MIKRTLPIFLSLILALSFTLSGCSKAEPCDFTLTVKSEGGQVLSDIRIFVHEGDSLVWAADSDSEGKTSFTGVAGKVYTVTLKEVPSGYKAEESYTVTQIDSSIILKTELLPESSLGTEKMELGSVFYDFTVTDSTGTTHKLSELLEIKKAVVLNFWFINCDPCKMEFPYLQEAYEEYSDVLEVIAINPVDGTDDKISAFAEKNGLTFPMANGDPLWETSLELTAYPTTVVIDRYGTVGMIHKGYITETETFTKIFDFFTSDSYVQTTVRNISDIEK